MNGPLVEELEWSAPHGLFHGLAAEPFALFLDSATAAPGKDTSLHGRWSFIAFDPFDRVSLRIAEVAKPYELLKTKLASLPALEMRNGMPPFPGGAAGFSAMASAERWNTCRRRSALSRSTISICPTWRSVSTTPPSPST